MIANKLDLTFSGKLDEHEILVARIYSASMSWNALCARLWIECEKHPEYRIAVNSICALSIELSLKTILSICGHSERCLKKSGHSLMNLMNKIGVHNYDVIKQSYERISGEGNFDEALRANDRSFDKWRYIMPEHGATHFVDDFDYSFMRWLQEALASLSEAAHDAFLSRESHNEI